jgi:hypothetical protein
MKDFITNLIKDALGRYPVGLALTLAFFISLAAVLAVGELTGNYTLPFIPVLVHSNTTLPPYAPALLFGVTWVVVFLIIIISARDQRDDSFTAIRTALVGHWEIRLRTLDKNKGVQPSQSIWLHYPVTVDLTEERKLKITFDQKNSRIFESSNFSSTAVHLGPMEQDVYRLVIRVTAPQRLLPDYHNPFAQDEISMPILFDLTFAYDSRTKKVSGLKGYWYDIDNIVYRVMYATLEAADVRQFIMASICEGTGNFRSQVTLAPAESG